MVDLIIRNGTVVTHTDQFEADVAVEGEKIVAIGKNLGSAKKEIDASGKYVMPGCIDPHTHIGIFIDNEKDLPAETLSAAAGGTTTILHCLIAPAPILETYNNCLEPIRRLASCDVGFYAALLTKDDLQQIPRLSELGVNSFKFLLAYKGKFGLSIGLEGVDINDGYLYDGMERIKQIGGLPMIHAEHVEMIEPIEAKFKNDNTLKTWCDARPNIAEEIDLYIGCKIAEEVKSPLYQVHSSVGTASNIVREFRDRGNQVFLETCPVYFLTDYYGEKFKSPLLGKVNPPIRSPKDREQVMAALKAGTIDCIGTDSASNMFESKWADGNIWNMVLDYSDVGAMLPLILSECVNKGTLTLPEVVRLTSYNAAKIHGLAPRKGIMAVGSDADLLVVDLNKKKTITAGNMHSSSDYYLYDGWEVTGWPVSTIIRGTEVVRDDKPVVEPGYGQFIPTKPAYRS
jgi:dihydropyrimidinase